MVAHYVPAITYSKLKSINGLQKGSRRRRCMHYSARRRVGRNWEHRRWCRFSLIFAVAHSSGDHLGASGGCSPLKNLICLTCHSGPRLGNCRFPRFAHRQRLRAIRGNITPKYHIVCCEKMVCETLTDT